MQNLKALLCDLETAFVRNMGYFQRTERLASVMFDAQVRPILKCIEKEAGGLLRQQYLLSDEDADTSSSGSSVVLIHYTTIAALVSILGGAEAINRKEAISGSVPNDALSFAQREPSSIRLYDTEHSNDQDEGEYLVRSLRLYEKYDWIEDRQAHHAYVASFIQPNDNANVRDNLVYWRTYGNNGEGCSISISIHKDKVRKVLYGEEGMSYTCTVVSTLLNKMDHIVSECELSSGIRRVLSASIWKILSQVQYLHKSDAYDYERECRFVVPWEEKIRDDVLFEYEEMNDQSPRIRHYIECNALDAREVLQSGSCITLGPRVTHRGSVRLLIEALLRTSGLPTQVKFSEISYRES